MKMQTCLYQHTVFASQLQFQIRKTVFQLKKPDSRFTLDLL